jgi:DNA-binding YbaB/EbfC family protein
MNKNMIRQAQQMQNQLAKIQAELESEMVEASVGGGAVVVTCTGHQRIKSITITPSAVDPSDVEMLQELVITAVNEALERSQTLASQRLNAVTGGFKIPGM